MKSLTPPVPSVVVFVTDVPRLSRFYRDVAMMRVVHEGPDHAVLSLDGFEVVVHALRGEPPVQKGPSGDPLVREDSYVKLCLPVDSIAAARARAAESGGALGPPDREWEGSGFRACDGHDPEGNVIQVREPAPR
ncbi:MAG: VOC family protein [Gemmatimonadota bacterium]